MTTTTRILQAMLLTTILLAGQALALAPPPKYADESFRLPAEPQSDTTDTFDVDFVDVDADGDLDVFLAQGTGFGIEPRPNRLYINDGTGFFADETLTRLPPGPHATSVDVSFGDVDGDGDPDAVVANVGPTQLLLNDGTGVFEDASATHLPPPPSAEEDISLEARLFDIDADGDLDIVIGNEVPFQPFTGAQNRIYINDGTGHYVDETSTRYPATIDQTSGFAFGDLDGDGDKDLAVSNNGQNRILINDGSGVFADETSTRFPTRDDASRHVEMADLDDDGDLDLYFVNSAAQQNRLYFNDGTGVFADVTAANLPAMNDTSIDVDLIDFDGDGDLDAYIANSGPRVGVPNPPPHTFAGEQNLLYLNNGTGSFSDKTAKWFPAVIDASFDAEVGDLDGDGDLDVVVGNVETHGMERLYIRT